MLDVAGQVMTALTTGGAVVARAEIARLVRGALTRLGRRGRPAQELAVIVDALARSDEDLATELDRLGDDGRTTAAQQLSEALTYTGTDEVEAAATATLAGQARQLSTVLTNHGVAIGTNTGIAVGTNSGTITQNIWHNIGPGTMHAPGAVTGDYHAGS